MSNVGIPFLAQFAAVPRTPESLPADCEIRPQTGLIHRADSNRPLIEELLDDFRRVDTAEETLITCTVEPIDPDNVRSQLVRMAETLLTEERSDPIDPDLVRAGWSGLFETMITKAEPDPPDPDYIRAAINHGFETMLSRDKDEAADPDLVRHVERRGT